VVFSVLFFVCFVLCARSFLCCFLSALFCAHGIFVLLFRLWFINFFCLICVFLLVFLWLNEILWAVLVLFFLFFEKIFCVRVGMFLRDLLALFFYSNIFCMLEK
jgi:hypothetical protein